MDLPIYLAVGLLASGYILNSNGRPVTSNSIINTNKKKQIQNQSGGSLISSPTNSNAIHPSNSNSDSLSRKSDMIGNIVPFYFNTLNETNLKRVKNPNYDSNELKKELVNLFASTPIEITRFESPISTTNNPDSNEISDWQGGPKGLYAENNLNQT